MIQLDDIIKYTEKVVVKGIVDANLPGADSGHLDEVELFIQQVHQKGVDAPQDEKQSGILDKALPGFPDQAARLQPVNKDSHGDDKKDMGDLVGIDTLRRTMRLGGQHGIGIEQKFC